MPIFTDGLLVTPLKSAWDPAALGSNMALSNANLTATHDATGGTPRGVRGAKGHSTGKFYFEIGVNTGALQNGLAPSSYAGTAMIGTASTTWAYKPDSGIIQSGSSTVLSGLDTIAAGVPGVMCFAVDLDAHKLWARKVGGNWNGNASYDPAAGTGGVTIPSGTWYPAASSSGAAVHTLNNGQEAFAGVRPANFFIWE